MPPNMVGLDSKGGLNLYRIFDVAGDLNVFAGRTLDVSSCYIAGAREWGAYQTPGAFEAMQREACTKLLGVHPVNGAGHSVAEERPEEVTRLLIEFLQRAKAVTRGEVDSGSSNR